MMLRESLPGTWKEVDEEVFEEQVGTGGTNGRERGKAKAWRMSQVEVLDLSGAS